MYITMIKKLSTEGGQLLYRNPGILAAARVARQQPDAPKQAPKAVTQIAQTAPPATVVKALSTPQEVAVPKKWPSTS